jgi:hypothetical protein
VVVGGGVVFAADVAVPDAVDVVVGDRVVVVLTAVLADPQAATPRANNAITALTRRPVLGLTSPLALFEAISST